MASKFFHVHHEFRAGKAQQWWETAQVAMAPGGGWDEAVAKNLEAGFYNHSFSPIGPEGPAFCIWEVREGITAEEFQEFIDGPNGVNFGLGAWMNICRRSTLRWRGNLISKKVLSHRTGGGSASSPSSASSAKPQWRCAAASASVSSVQAGWAEHVRPDGDPLRMRGRRIGLEMTELAAVRSTATLHHHLFLAPRESCGP